MTRYRKTMSEAYREVYNLSEKMSSSQIAKLKKAYEPMRDKKISTANAEKLMKIMDMVDKDKNVLIQLFKADIPFVSELAVTRLITKHKMKGAEINKLKSEALDKEDEPKVKDVINQLKGAVKAHDSQAKELEKAIKDEVEIDEAMLNLSTVKFQAKDKLGKIRHKVTQKGKKYIISVDSNDEEDAQKAMKDHPLYVAGKLRVVPEEVELDEKYDLYHKDFSGAMQHAYDYAKKKMGIVIDPKEIDNKVATGPKKPSDGKTNTYRLKGKGGNLQIQVYNKGGSKPFELNMYKEEVELDENYRKLAMKGIGTETKKAAKVGLKTDYYLPKNGDKSFGKITRVSSTGYEITDEKSKKVYKFKFYDPNNDPTSVRGTREEVELDEMDMKYVLINVQNKVQGYASDKKDALDIARRTKSTMHKIKKKISDKTLEKMNALAKTPKELKDLGIIEEVELDEKVSYVAYKFKSEIDAKNAKRYFDGIQLMGFDINDDDIRNGFLNVDAGSKDMTKYHKEVMKKFKPHVFAQESLDEKFSPKEIKMAIGIASDKRYAGGNYTGAVNAIEKIKKGLSKHKQVAAVLQRQNEELEESKKALKAKSDKSGVSVGILSKVYDRGMAAWKGGHRPGTTPQQWALARVNSFLTGGGARKADNDLWKKAKKEEVKINEDAVKSAQDKLDKVKKIQDLKDKIKDIRGEGARADAMRAMRTKRGVDPADIDTDATDDDMKAASKNIIMQLRKSVSLGKNFKVEFGDKKKMAVDPKIAQAVMNKYMSFRKPMDKEKFQSKIAKSYKDMLRTMKESIHEEEEKPDNTKFTDRIKKAQERVRNATKGTQEHSDALDALQNAKDAYANYKKKTAGGKLKSTLKKTAIATGIGAIATAKLGDSYDPKIKREAILDRIDRKLEEKKNG